MAPAPEAQVEARLSGLGVWLWAHGILVMPAGRPHPLPAEKPLEEGQAVAAAGCTELTPVQWRGL